MRMDHDEQSGVYQGKEDPMPFPRLFDFHSPESDALAIRPMTLATRLIRSRTLSIASWIAESQVDGCCNGQL